MLFGAVTVVSLALTGKPPDPPCRGKNYPDGHGGQVCFPLGDVSFADDVVSYQPGSPSPQKGQLDPKRALGPPEKKESSVSLGCGGTLVLRFTDNALVDVEGPDLYVFEVGPRVESTTLAVSRDGATWLEVGKIEGGKAEIDLVGLVQPGEVLRFVRLTDMSKGGCGGASPGADIEAVGAIGSGVALSLSSQVLFDTGKSDLKPEAKAALERAAGEIRRYPGARLAVGGHTDSQGSDAFNLALSKARAAAVLTFLQHLESLELGVATAEGYGETRPVASNDSEEGRAKNRRVEVVVMPGS